MVTGAVTRERHHPRWRFVLTLGSAAGRLARGEPPADVRDPRRAHTRRPALGHATARFAGVRPIAARDLDEGEPVAERSLAASGLHAGGTVGSGGWASRHQQLR